MKKLYFLAALMAIIGTANATYEINMTTYNLVNGNPGSCTFTQVASTSTFTFFCNWQGGGANGDATVYTSGSNIAILTSSSSDGANWAYEGIINSSHTQAGGTWFSQYGTLAQYGNWQAAITNVTGTK